MARGRILVVGAGIGGLAAAIGLRQQDWQVDVVEITPDVTVSGVGIIQPSNALRALDQLGLARDCVAAGGGFPGWRLFTGDGAPIAEAPNRNVSGEGLPAVNGITRRRLHQIMIDATARAGASLRYGVTIETLRQHDEGVEVLTTDGASVRYDLVLGVDGVFSTIRQMIFPNAPTPTFTGEGVWRCNFPRPAEVDWGRIYYGRQSKVGLVPMSPDLMYLFAVTAEPDMPRFQDHELAPAMRARVAEYGGLIGELRDQIGDHSSIVYKPLQTVLQPLPWRSGRILLIGDAVHATTPHLAQGAALALEDAVLLSQMLVEGAGMEASIDTFAERRFPRARLVVEASVKLGEWELAEWRGEPDPDANPGGLFHEAIEAMTAPI